MKLAAAVIIVMCCGLIGTELFRRQTNARDQLGDIHSLCLHMIGCVRYDQPDPEQIILSYDSASNGIVKLCIELIASGCDFSEAWCKAADICVKASFRSEEISLIRRLGAEFGRSDAESELMRLEHISEKLSILHKKRCEECSANRKLYTTSGFLAGVLLAILML